MTNYDVFISCKSEDYSLAEEVYSFLNAHHIHTFLASKELRKLGDSEYREAIEDALECAEHLIILASKPEYIKSEWVKYEWRLFLNAKIDGYKEGNIITILNSIEPKDISFALRRYESFSYSNFKESIITYVETEASVNRAKKAKEEERDLAAQRAIEEQQKKLELAKTELIQLAEDYKKSLSNLDVTKAKINAIKNVIGTTKYICPICDSENGIDAKHCATCGWIFSPIEGIEGAEYLLIERQKAIQQQRQIFSQCSRLSIHLSKTDELSAQISTLREENAQLNEELEYARLEKDDFTQNITKLNEIISEKDSQITQLATSIKGLRQDSSRQEQIQKDSKNEINELKTKLKTIQKDRDDTVANLEREINDLKNKLLSLERQSALRHVSQSNVTTCSSSGNTNTKGAFFVWITFATKDVEDIVKQYNDSFSGFARNNNGTIIK